VAAQFAGAGKVLNVTFGLSEMQGMIIGALIIVLYTIMGGFFAVAWTDVIQGIIMFGTLVILPVVAFIELKTLGTNGAIWDTQTLYGGKIGWGAFAAAIGGLSWGLGYLGQPHLVVRYMAINSSDNIGVSRKNCLCLGRSGLLWFAVYWINRFTYSECRCIIIRR